MSSGGKGNSRARTTTASTSQTTNDTYVDNSVRTSDYGAVAASTEISRDAIDLGRRTVEAGYDFGRDTLDSSFNFGADVVRDGFDFGSNALDFGRDSLDTVGRGVDSAIDAVTRSNSDSLDFGRDSLDAVTTGFGDSLATIADFAESSGAGVLNFAEGLFNKSVGGLNDLAMQTSASTDDRVAKVASMAFLAVAAIMVLPKVFEK